VAQGIFKSQIASPPFSIHERHGRLNLLAGTQNGNGVFGVGLNERDYANARPAHWFA
jgi:hypothetical protein